MKGTVHEVDCTRRRRYMTGTVYEEMTGTRMKRQYMKGTVYEKTVHEGDCIRRRWYMTGTVYEGDSTLMGLHMKGTVGR